MGAGAGRGADRQGETVEQLQMRGGPAQLVVQGGLDHSPGGRVVDAVDHRAQHPGQGRLEEPVLAGVGGQLGRCQLAGLPAPVERMEKEPPPFKGVGQGV